MSSRPDLGPKPYLGYTANLLDRAVQCVAMRRRYPRSEPMRVPPPMSSPAN